MSLTKEEIHDFVSNYFFEFGDDRFKEKSDDHAIRTLGKFLGSHHLNPIEAHDFTFFARNSEEPWEFSEYYITWEPEVALGIGAFEYKYVRIAVSLRKEGAGRPRGYLFKGGAGITII